MRTLTPGAARRRATTETVRERMATLLAADPPARPPADGHDAGGHGGGGHDADGPGGGGFGSDGNDRDGYRVDGHGSDGHDRDGRSDEPGGDGGPPEESLVGTPLAEWDPGSSLPPGGPPPPAAGARPHQRIHEPDHRPPRSAFTSLLRPALALDRRAVMGLAVLLLLAVAYAVQHFWLGRPQPVQVPVAAASTARAGPDEPVPAGPESSGAAGPETSGVAGPESTGAAVVVVDIAGRVRIPGLRELPGGSRVADALRAAGGALPDTDTTALNLARVLADGEQILVGAPESGIPLAPPGAAGPTSGPVSLNRATPEQLDALPGVGPTLARRIITFRQAHGPFRSLDQLRQVSGIGERTLAEMKPLLTL
ncbi:helix-hairpin-helix domain-containing protein [Kitasatospora sp. NBC_00315]|uniref:helix-hairpin-helix domain-containing protein n=1 Tax=Kitasatospora sp. NBC_00315 TaxID=2975963 RepID=UPI00324DD676